MADYPRQGPEERLTPYKLLVAVLFREYIRLRRELVIDPLTSKASPSVKEKERDDCRNYLVRNAAGVLVMSAKEAFDTLRLLQHLARSPERDFTSLIGLIRLVLVKPHFLLFRRVVELLRKDEQDEVARYIDLNLTQVIQSAKMEHSIGSNFVHNVKLLFEEMNFTDCDRFSLTLAAYINAGFRHLDEMYNNFTSFMERTDRLEDPAVSVAPLTDSQSDYVLSKEAELMESNPVAAGDRAGADEQVAQALNLKPCTQNVAYVQFLDAIRRRNYDDALDAVQRYSVLKGVPEERHWLNPEHTSVGLQPGEASLHICIMHHNAGHSALALQSLKECIFLAQEKGDTPLLSTCMYWLACLEVNNNQYEKLFRGARGGDFLKYPDIMKQFATLIARFDALSGASTLQSLHDLNYAEAIGDAGGRVVALIQQYTGRASFWKMHGFEDIAAVYAQASVQILSGSRAYSFPVATEAVALSLGFLLEQAVRLNDDNALEVLFDYSNETFPIDSSRDWPAWGLAELVWKYQRAFNQQNYSACEVIIDQLSVVSVVEASLRRAELLYVKDLMPLKALSLLTGMYDATKNITAHVKDLTASSTTLKMRILMLKSDVYLQTGCGVEALDAAREALGLAMDHRNLLFKARIQLQLAFVWLELKEVSQARNCLALAFPYLAGCGYPLDQGKAWLLKGKLLWPDISAGSLKQVHAFEMAVESFARCFSVKHMLECLYLIAGVYDKLSRVTERDDVASMFIGLQDKFPAVSLQSSCEL